MPFSNMIYTCPHLNLQKPFLAKNKQACVITLLFSEQEKSTPDKFVTETGPLIHP